MLVLLSITTFLAACTTIVSRREESSANVQTLVSDTEVLYFAETGHTIQAPFLAYYLGHNGATLLGYPITEIITHDGWQVQYFQNARLEVHPENHPDYFITVGWLGQLSHRTRPPIQKTTAISGLYVPQTGHTIQGDFLRYFTANGNSVQFGQPISEPYLLDGQVVQDFQSARFAWNPHFPSRARVQLEPLGETYFLDSGLDPGLLEAVPVPPNAKLYQPPPGPRLPETVEVSLEVEETVNPAIIRLLATFINEDRPLEAYAPQLIWGENQRQLPPTNPAGQTHTLVDISAFQGTIFTLYTASEQIRLTYTIYPASEE